jgi:hypothetical protein
MKELSRLMAFGMIFHQNAIVKYFLAKRTGGRAPSRE